MIQRLPTKSAAQYDQEAFYCLMADMNNALLAIECAEIRLAEQIAKRINTPINFLPELKDKLSQLRRYAMEEMVSADRLEAFYSEGRQKQ